MNKELYLRNTGYINEETQSKLFTTKILLTGCGLGSYIAECLVRMGCQNLTLVDHDTINTHNLNRQNFTYNDINRYKSESLTNRLLAISPDLNVQFFNEPLSASNVEMLVADTDYIIDTIDFLSVDALMLLYHFGHLYKKATISAINAGWGAIAFYISPKNQNRNWFAKVFNIPEGQETELQTYAYYFKNFFMRISKFLPNDVLNNLLEIVTKMEENKPCPASQIAPGAFAAAALCGTVLHRAISGLEVVELPFAMAYNLNSIAEIASIPFMDLERGV